MEHAPQLTSADAHRRRRTVAVLAAAILAAAAALFLLESGGAIVVYNDTGEPLPGVAVVVGAASWDAGPLEPRESRRWAPPRGAGGPVQVVVDGWAAPIVVGPAYPADGSLRLTLRLGPLQTATAAEARAWWRGWER